MAIVQQHTPLTSPESPETSESPARQQRVVIAPIKTVALLSVLMLVSSTALGFGGGYLASQTSRPISNLDPASSVSVAADRRSEQTDSPAGSADSTIADSATIGSDATSPSRLVSQQTGPVLTVAEIASLAAPSVVEISTEVQIGSPQLPQAIAAGAGSGVIVSSDGLIVTNNHVIDSAQKISVRLADGSEHAANLVSTDAQTDIALIQIDATGLTAATLGDSSQLTVGDLAVAIGNPLGQLGGTVTDGIISALDREITLDQETMNLLQTNAAINPGNSGGGLFNAQGQLIGIVVAKSSGSDVEGLGFAIPINDAKAVIDDLKQYGSVQGRITLGLTLLDIDSEETALMYRVSQPGVYVLKAEPGQPAANAGLQSGDRIVALNSEAVLNSQALKEKIQAHQIGDTLAITIDRDGQLLSLDVPLPAEKPAV